MILHQNTQNSIDSADFPSFQDHLLQESSFQQFCSKKQSLQDHFPPKSLQQQDSSTDQSFQDHSSQEASFQLFLSKNQSLQDHLKHFPVPSTEFHPKQHHKWTSSPKHFQPPRRSPLLPTPVYSHQQHLPGPLPGYSHNHWKQGIPRPYNITSKRQQIPLLPTTIPLHLSSVT